MVPDAESLASCRAGRAAYGPLHLDAVGNSDARASLARPHADGRRGAAVPGTVQELPGAGGWAFSDALPLRRGQCPEGEACQTGRVVAMVQPVGPPTLPKYIGIAPGTMVTAVAGEPPANLAGRRPPDD